MKEIELKYALNTQGQGLSIMEALPLQAFAIKKERETIEMSALYYDTKDWALRKNKIAYRIRKENDLLVATLKWGGNASQGLSVRNEENIPVRDDRANLGVFQEAITDASLREILESLNEKILVPMVQTAFTRNAAIFQFKESLIEMAVDTGKIIASNQTLPICEMELELLDGEVASLVEAGNYICAKYKLQKESQSKFKRGFLLHKT